jgi:hypothetical protein
MITIVRKKLPRLYHILAKIGNELSPEDRFRVAKMMAIIDREIGLLRYATSPSEEYKEYQARIESAMEAYGVTFDGKNRVLDDAMEAYQDAVFKVKQSYSQVIANEFDRVKSSEAFIGQSVDIDLGEEGIIERTWMHKCSVEEMQLLLEIGIIQE